MHHRLRSSRRRCAALPRNKAKDALSDGERGDDAAEEADTFSQESEEIDAFSGEGGGRTRPRRTLIGLKRNGKEITYLGALLCFWLSFGALKKVI